jgi:hypothetical protein
VAGMASGLRWQRTADVLRTFVSQYGAAVPRRAILCTYDFDVERFEAVLFPELTRRGRQFRTLVTADAGALQAHLRQIGARRFGRFQVSPVRCLRGGVFHPKLVLLAAGRRHLVGVGSANLTPGGLGGNLEMMLFADDATDHGRRLLGGAAHFLDRLVQHEHLQLPEPAREFVNVTLAGIRRDPSGLFDSLEMALVDQMAETRGERSRTVNAPALTVLSPWHSAVASPEGVDPSVLRRLKRAFGASRVTVFTEGRNGRGPNLGVDTRVHIRVEKPSPRCKNGELAEEEEANLERRPTRVHAKAYLVEDSGEGGMLFFGSANCTHRGMTLAVAGGGNVELLVVSKLKAAEIAAVRGDLADLFVPADKTFTVTATRAPVQPAGLILAGQISEGAAGPRLRIEAPTLHQGSVEIAATPKCKLVRAHVNRGVGWVEDRTQIRLLFGEATPARSNDSWGGVLWERVGKRFAPFPVVVPLAAGDHETPDGALFDLVWEELGLWPSQADSKETKTDDEQIASMSEEDDEDLQALAEARHEGQLDRLAVAVSVLRKRIAAAGAGSAYAKARLDLLRTQIAKLDMPKHVRRALIDYLNSPHRAPRSK